MFVVSVAVEGLWGGFERALWLDLGEGLGIGMKEEERERVVLVAVAF